MCRFSSFGGRHSTDAEDELVSCGGDVGDALGGGGGAMSAFELQEMELELKMWNNKSVQVGVVRLRVGFLALHIGHEGSGF